MIDVKLLVFWYDLFLYTSFPIPLAWSVLIMSVFQVMSVVLPDRSLHSFPDIYNSIKRWDFSLCASRHRGQ